MLTLSCICVPIQNRKKRHLRLLHPKQGKARKDPGASRKSLFCNFKLDSGNVCGKGFNTIYQLRLHKKTAKHQKKECPTPKTRGKSKTGQSYAARLIRSFSKVQHLSSSESDDQSEKDTEAADQAETRESDKDQMDQEMDTDEAQVKSQGRNLGKVDTDEAEVHGSINPHDTDQAEASGSDDAGAQADSEVNPEDTGKQCTFPRGGVPT